MTRQISRTGALCTCAIALACLPVAFSAAAGLARTGGEIRIDGVMDEAAWADATSISVDIETGPGENTPAPVETTAYLIEDGSSLYVAFDARDPEPGAIRAYLRDRDTVFRDDSVGIVLDTFGDERRAFIFMANALGVQMDLTNDESRGHEDTSWDAIWDSAGRITEDGYVVEMEIPLSQLRFPDTKDAKRWGVDAVRFYPRSNRHRLASNPLDRNRNCYLCQLKKMDALEGVEPALDFEVTPTLTGIRTETTDDPGITPLADEGTDIDGGLSVRWGITPDVTANLAINPDFSQVEADVAQLDVNNQFALFFPEKRPFFLEGADYFNTPVAVVFTRTVADPDAGVKLTGKKGNHTFGGYAARDAVTNLLFPGAFGSDSTSLEEENTSFVGRYSYGFGKASSIGALVTVREGHEYDNNVRGFDLRWRISDQHTVSAQYLHSRTKYPADIVTEFEQPDGGFSGEAAYLSYRYESRDWYGHLRHLDQSAGFRADLGFVPRVDTKVSAVGIGRLWHGDEDNWWHRMRLSGDWDIAYDDQGRMIEREAEVEFNIGGPLQSWLQIGAEASRVLFDDVMFRQSNIDIFGQIQPRGGLVLSLFAKMGDQIDFANTRLGDQLRLQPVINWNINRNLLLRLRSTLVTLDSKEGPNIFEASVYDARITWQFSRRSFLRVTLQQQDVERNPDLYLDEVDVRTKDFGRQLLYSYKVNPQTVFFLGYSDKHINDDSLDRLTATDRTLFAKVGYAWTP